MAPKRTSVSGPGNSEADRVRVVVRIRPPVRKDEKFGEGSEALQYDAEKNLLFLLAKEEDDKKSDPKQFVFDKVLWKDSQQHDAWEAAGMPIVNSVLEGYTGCVMCYGQTGAGKSFTLANESKGQEGIMIAAFHHIFARAAESRDLKYEVAISYQQIYLDTITDLLNPSGDIELREDPKHGVYVAGAKWDTVDSAAAALKVLQKGNSNRATACTKMNSASSRSHAALIVKVTCTGGTRTLSGMLYLVDLAGSERVKKSGVEGAAFDEAKAINQSLTTLGRCIEVLASNKKEKPPFRESKLTRLLSNAIGGAAKTTLVVCVAPTMTDQFETVNSLDFGQQAMNVVVRAKVNASTDYGSLTASLLMQRDLKQRPIRELEVKVLKELAPQLDAVVKLEHECKRASMDVELMEEKVDAEKDRLAAAQARGEEEEEVDKAKMVQLLNERAQVTAELEEVLVRLSSDPEMKRIQDEHEAEKAASLNRSMQLQEELRTSELQERHERKTVDTKLEGVIHTARNLGQIAAYFLQTGAMAEAADFYTQAKSIFDTMLGPDHPKTQAWQEDLFFLINAPAIQQMVKRTAKELQQNQANKPAGADAGPEAAPSAPEWWMQNLFDMGHHGGGDDDDGDNGTNWWMQNLYDMNTRIPTGPGDEKAGDADYMGVIFGTPRGDGTNTARGGPAFTPRGTLVALSQAHGKASHAVALGMPLKKENGETYSMPEEDALNMGFTKDWVSKIFTPRAANTGLSNEEVEANMADAVAWLQENFGATPRNMGGDEATGTKGASRQEISEAVSGAFTPRGSASAGLLNIMMTESDDAVFHAAMQATLMTPRGGASVDDTPMAGAVHKMFKGKLQHV